MSSPGFINWINGTIRPPTPIRSISDLASMDVAQLALLIVATRKLTIDEVAIYAAQRKYFYFGIVDGAKGSLAAHRANLRGVVLLLNDYSLLGGEDIHGLSSGLSSPDLQAYQPALIRLLDVIYTTLHKVATLNSPSIEWSRLRTKLDDKEMSSGAMNFPTNPIGEEVQNSVAQWPSGWEDAIQDANLTMEDINSLATLESISHHLEKSFDMVARYLPLLGLRPIEYRRHYNLDGRPEIAEGESSSTTTSSDEERAWFATLTGAAAVYYTEVGVGGTHTIIPEVAPIAVPVPSATTPQTTTPQSRITPGAKRMRSPAPPVVSRFGGGGGPTPSSSMQQRRGAAPPPVTPPSCTPSNRSSTHTDDGSGATTNHPVSSAQRTRDYINRCEDRITDQCIRGVQPGELGCVTRHVGRFPVEKSPTDIERELLWADIGKCLTAKLPHHQ